MSDLQRYVQVTITEILEAMRGISEDQSLVDLGATAFPLITHADDLSNVQIFKSQVLTEDGETEHRPVICFQFDIGVEISDTENTSDGGGGFDVKVGGVAIGAKGDDNSSKENSLSTANRVKFTVPIQIKPDYDLSIEYEKGAKVIQDKEKEKRAKATAKAGRNRRSSWVNS